MSRCLVRVFAENDFRTYESAIEDCKIVELVTAKTNLIRFLELFELYEQLLDAHIEVKSVFYRLNIESTLKSDDRAQYFHRTRNELNRRLFNTLNLGKLYLDKHFFQNKSFVLKVTECSQKHQEVQKHRENLFESNLHYMIGCELRRFSQHVSIMTRVISRGIKFDENSGALTSTLSASILRDELSQGVKTSHKKLERMPEKINLQETLDGYIDAISEMHFVNLDLTLSTFGELIELLDSFGLSACNKANLNAKDGYSLEVYTANSEESRRKVFSVSSDWLDLLKHVKTKFRGRTQFSRTTHL